jgi:Ca2+-binding EF-hand superfamily protein
MLKKKFGGQYTSVKEAFLCLDTNYDGVIDAEDILRQFSNEDKIDYADLHKLIKDKDSKHVGQLSYTDFSKWLGCAVHQISGFYFRHDSVKNPPFESYQQKQERKYSKEGTATIVAANLGDHSELEKKVMEKMKFSWKRVRTAFAQINISKTGFITRDDLQLFFAPWQLSNEQFEWLFNKFDQDKDGKISYRDFSNTVGLELFPQEGLYFRQEKTKTDHI